MEHRYLKSTILKQLSNEIYVVSDDIDARCEENRLKRRINTIVKQKMKKFKNDMKVVANEEVRRCVDEYTNRVVPVPAELPNHTTPSHINSLQHGRQHHYNHFTTPVNVTLTTQKHFTLFTFSSPMNTKRAKRFINHIYHKNNNSNPSIVHLSSILSIMNFISSASPISGERILRNGENDLLLPRTAANHMLISSTDNSGHTQW